MKARAVWVAVALAALAVSAAVASSSTAAVAKGNGKLSLALIVGHKGSPFYTSMTCGAQAEAKKTGVNLSVTGPTTWDASLQVPIVNAVVATHPSAIMIVPNDEHALVAPLQQAKNAGIKVITADTALVPNSGIPSGAVTSQSYSGGVLGAKTLARLIGGKGLVLLVSTDPGISTSAARARGFIATIKKYPGIKLLPEQFTQDATGKGALIVSATLAAHPDLKGIFATDQDGGDGGASALKSAGAQNKVTLVGFDAEPSEIVELKQGLVKALVEQKPYLEGQVAVQMAIAASQNKPFQKTVLTSLALVTKANLDEPQIARYLYKSSC